MRGLIGTMLGTRRSIYVAMAMRRVATRSIRRPTVYSQPRLTALATRPASVRTLSQGPGSQSATGMPRDGVRSGELKVVIVSSHS